ALQFFDLCRCTLLVLILSCCLLSEAHGHCSLEKMKTFAREACERLFQQDEPREKRSIDNAQNHINTYVTHEKVHKNQHFIGRSTYPKGGYLKVSTQHYHRLMNLDVMPRYKPTKPNKGTKMRFKRDHSGKHYNNISYCCFHLCDEEFFC
ncbi:hypothetical protein KR222_010542, partial [Zaprionus bogoriensis]